MPVQTIPPMVQRMQNMAVMSPSVKSEYEFPDANNGYPLRTTRYGQPLVPIQEQLAMQQLQTQQQREQLEVSGQQLNQVLAQKKDLYDTRVNQQALTATQQLGDFDPKSPDFEAKFTEFQKANPLAFQNPGFRELASRLLSTRQQHVHSEETDDRTFIGRQAAAQAQQEILKQHSVNSTRGEAAKYGEDALSAYDEALASNGGDPFNALAVSQKQISRAKEDSTTAKAIARQFTPADYNAMSLRHDNFLKGPKGEKLEYDDLSSRDKQRYDFLDKQLQEYESLHSDQSSSVNSKVTPGSLVGAGASSATPTPIANGTRAVNKQTGEVKIYRDGNWVTQ